MFDFFKLSAPAKYSEQLLNAENLSFQQSITKDGVIITTEHGFSINRAKILCFDVIVWQHPTQPHRIEIKGSFHKSHEGETNFKDFTFLEFRSAVKQLCDCLNIPPTELNIHLFEIGVNISPPIETKFLIEGIKSVSGKKFERETYNGNGLLFRFDFSQYQIKIYDKGFQFIQPGQILRFELKVKKMAYINTKEANITTLQDLLTGNWNEYFGELLLKQWDKVIICPEGIINPELITNPRTRKNFLNGLNPDYWTNIPEKAYRRQIKAFKTIFQQMATIDIYSNTRALIREKWEHLSKPQKVENYPYVYGNNIPFDKHQTEKRFCQTCGRDITNQKRGSKFCSETIHGPEVKKCRNIESNPRNNRKRKEQRMYPGPTLFPVYIHLGIL